VSPLFSDSYLQAFYCGEFRGLQVILAYWRRLRALVKVRNYDLIWIEKEAFPFMPALAEWILRKVDVPYVVDYDDAVFHRYDSHGSWLIRSLLGRKIDAVMRHSALVVAGNDYLADRATAAGARRVEIVPTVVDLTRYAVVQSAANDPLVVGWIGSPATIRYLSAIAPVFESLYKECRVRFVAVGGSDEAVSKLPIEARPWLEDTEVRSIQSFDIGIMPLPDSPFERGKCGYKLIQYMACGLPVVASPVGVNKKIVEHGVNGFIAQEMHEWKQALRLLLSDQLLRRRMGSNGRDRVEKWYSLQVQAPRLELLMRGVLS
jgi:glycosyltransferase involved in cell wall biosynthesis